MVQKNFQAVDETLAHLHEVQVPLEVGAPALVGAGATASQHHAPVPMMLLQRRQPVADEAPEFVRNVLGKMIAGEGDT